MLRKYYEVKQSGEGFSAEKMAEIRACKRVKNEPGRTIAGMSIGALLVGVPVLLAPIKTNISTTIIAGSIGAIYGYIVSHYISIKECLDKVINDQDVPNLNLKMIPPDSVNVYENRKNRLENQELDEAETPTKGFINLLDEFPVNNEGEDAQNNTVPEGTLTYAELRRRNREEYNLKNPEQQSKFRLWIGDRNKEQPVQVKELDKETKEPDFFPDQGTGNHKTKYGDVWD